MTVKGGVAINLASRTTPAQLGIWTVKFLGLKSVSGLLGLKGDSRGFLHIEVVRVLVMLPGGLVDRG